MEKSQNKSNILIVILIILNLIGLLIIGFLLYEINNMKKPNAIAYNDILGETSKNNNLVNDIDKNNNVIKNDVNNVNSEIKNDINNSESNNANEGNEKPEITDWELTLVNYDNSLSEDFEVKLSSIDKTRKFDSRAIKYLNDMLLDMKAQNVKGAWIQSSYRSVADQTRVFNEEVSKQMKLRKIKRRGRKGNFKDN